MTYLLPFLASLAACCTPAQETKKPTIKATVQEVDPKKDEPPGFLCEGTTDLPDGCRIDVFTYFDARLEADRKDRYVPETGAHRHHSVVTVKDGKFSAAFAIYTPSAKKNLAGDYTFRVKFDPNFQPAQFATLGPILNDLPFKVGKPGDEAKDRAAVGAKLFDEIKALVVIADESAAKRKEDKAKGKSDPTAWSALMKDWTKRLGDINQRVSKEPEYVVLDMNVISNVGFEHLTGIVMDLARYASRGQDKDFREGRERLDVMVSKYNNDLTGAPIDPKIARVELLKDARGWLDTAVNARDDQGPLGKKNFRQAMMNLHKIAPADARPTILEMSAAATEIFDALDAKKDAKALFEKLDARLGELLKEFKSEK